MDGENPQPQIEDNAIVDEIIDDEEPRSEDNASTDENVDDEEPQTEDVAIRDENVVNEKPRRRGRGSRLKKKIMDIKARPKPQIRAIKMKFRRKSRNRTSSEENVILEGDLCDKVNFHAKVNDSTNSMTVMSQLVVPVTLWGKVAPTHCISCIYLTRNQKTIATGCNDGQICLWDVDENFKIMPRCLLFGHSAPVLCLAEGNYNSGASHLVSSSENGEMSLWDMIDGRCIETTKLPYVHTNTQAYHMLGTSEIRLFCNGYYAEIVVIDSFTLDILFVLSPRVNPDWISAMHILRPTKREDDVILALSTTGHVKIWTLNNNECRSAEPIYENESKPIRCLNALSLTCCAYNQRTVLIVCTKYWQIYDAGDFALLCSVDNRCGERWSGGEFLSSDCVIAWSDEGKGYIYKLPTNCIVESKDFHTRSRANDQPFLYRVLSCSTNSVKLSCPPAMRHCVTNRGQYQQVLLRGDSVGRLMVWMIPQIDPQDILRLQQSNAKSPPDMKDPDINFSLQEAWDSMSPTPPGILDQMENEGGGNPSLTASIYLPIQGRLVCGRDDGSIIIVPGTQTILLQLLSGRHHAYCDWPPHQILHAHNGRVNCLLYPHSINNRYDICHLVSGGVDFSVCLWDIYAGTLLHTFCVQAGEITQLTVPPANCNSRILQCVCSVASDHSVALLGLKERKCVILASRHLFPVQVIKWRPPDDFMIIGCTDGTVYVWQLETGHLDRVVQGLSAEDILSACDENIVSAGDKMTNPAVHLFRGLRHRNLAAIRQAAQRGLNHLQNPSSQQNMGTTDAQKSRAHPLMIQGLRTNPKDQESHVLFFDIEALIVQLLTEEYSVMSPGALEAQGLINQSEYQKVASLTQSSMPGTKKKIVDYISKVKDHAENAAQKIQAKAEIVGFKPNEMVTSRKDSSAEGNFNKPRQLMMVETNHTLEIAQLLLSLLHGWGLDTDLDRVCESKLGLLRPFIPVSFGLLSRAGHMSLFLPTYRYKKKSDSSKEKDKEKMENMKNVKISVLPPELMELARRTQEFTSRFHWELSTAVTTHHLLSLVSIANTLMSMNNATFIPEQEKKRKLHRRLSRADSKSSNKVSDNPNNQTEEQEIEVYTGQQTQIKQGWSLLAALHSVLLPDLIKSADFKRLQVDMLARRWQDRCLEVRDAAQALLLAELKRIGPKGRKTIVDEWSPFLPTYTDPYPSNLQGGGGNQNAGQNQQTQNENLNSETGLSNGQKDNGNSPDHEKTNGDPHHNDDDESEDDDEEDDSSVRKLSSAVEAKRKQSTAIVLLGVIGAEYGHETEQSRRKSAEDQKKKSVIEGFGPGNYSLARHTSKALAYLLIAPATPKLPAHTSLRRASVDLIGRGFTVWEPYLDVSKILLGLLELCCDSNKLVPSMTYGLPLTPAADSCRTARHALSLIATARPPAYITTMAKEVARYNTLAQNAQALNVNLSHSILNRSKPEILRVVELLIDKMQTDVADLLVEVMDITLHCLDNGQLKSKGLKEIFPAICRFNAVSYCSQTKRIAVGAKNGNLAIYELRSSKNQIIPAHSLAINACCFSPDGKFLASYSSGENKICFWQTATGLFGLGNSQTKCVRTYNTDSLPEAIKVNVLKMVTLVWKTQKVVILMLSNGTEYRFNV